MPMHAGFHILITKKLYLLMLCVLSLLLDPNLVIFFKNCSITLSHYTTFEHFTLFALSRILFLCYFYKIFSSLHFYSLIYTDQGWEFAHPFFEQIDHFLKAKEWFAREKEQITLFLKVMRANRSCHSLKKID